MRAQGRSTTYAVGLWSAAAVLLTAAVLVGAGPLSTVSDETISLPLAFAAGAVVASLADTLMPEAYEQGGPLVALSTALGFVLSFLLATLRLSRRYRAGGLLNRAESHAAATGSSKGIGVDAMPLVTSSCSCPRADPPDRRGNEGSGLAPADRGLFVFDRHHHIRAEEPR